MYTGGQLHIASDVFLLLLILGIGMTAWSQRGQGLHKHAVSRVCFDDFVNLLSAHSQTARLSESVTKSPDPTHTALTSKLRRKHHVTSTRISFATIKPRVGLWYATIARNSPDSSATLLVYYATSARKSHTPIPIPVNRSAAFIRRTACRVHR
jgi:hypothetical protein